MLRTLFLVLILLCSVFPFLGFAQQPASNDTFIPLVPDLPFIGASADVSQLLNGLFAITIGAAAMLAVIMFAIGGFRYMLSEAIPSKGSAVSQMRDAILGLGIILASVIILQTINPNIVTLQLFNPAIVDPASGTVLIVPQQAPTGGSRFVETTYTCTQVGSCECPRSVSGAPLVNQAPLGNSGGTGPTRLKCTYDVTQRDTGGTIGGDTGGTTTGGGTTGDVQGPPPPPPPPPPI